MPDKGIITSVYLVLNTISSIVLVLLNKWVYVYVGFPNITLTFLHFVTTFLGLYFCQKCNVFQVKIVPIRDMVPLAFTFCGFVVFTNLSLETNTVGTYQVAKVMTTPCVILLQMLFYGKKFAIGVKLTLIPITVGVILNFYYDIQFSILGTLYATLGVLVTSLYQVWVSQKQHDLQMNSMQLLYYQAPLSAAILLFLIPFLEPVQSTIHHVWSIHSIVQPCGGFMCDRLLCQPVHLLDHRKHLSTHVSFMTTSHIAMFWGEPLDLVVWYKEMLPNISYEYYSLWWYTGVLSLTRSFRYNMVGHMKFCLTVLGGVLLFHDPFHVNQVVGIVCTIVGVTMYAHVKMKDHHKDSEEDEESLVESIDIHDDRKLEEK
uniref:Sugar phosphate transporter domain-containing protein n=1 Tax=Timema genevievae TaxID=629358 RepID=A0A7R9K5R5_TIMGE|nr:unnamed protein product [Timema genevievae]